MVVRNENGECIAALSSHFSHISSALHMEAEACRAGLLIAIHQGWDAVELESDCATIISSLANNLVDLSVVGRIIDDCHMYKAEVTSFQVRHIYRETNGVTHHLAYRVSFSFLDNL